MTKFDVNDKKGNPITLETDSHGTIRSTFKKLNNMGYLQNYQENYMKDKRFILAKLAFGNFKLSELIKKDAKYNIKFQRTEKQIDFEDPEFRKMFPLVFSKKGILERQGYKIETNTEGIPTIKYNIAKEKSKHNENYQKEGNLRDEIKVDISPEEQKDTVKKFIEQQDNTKEQTKQNTEKII